MANLQSSTISGNLNITGSITASSAQFTTISASSYNGTFIASAGGPLTSVQFNNLGSLSGSSNLIYTNGTNTLSGVVAQFTILTGSNASFTNKVGIGTGNPLTKLHVSGGTGLAIDTVNAQWATFGADVASANFMAFKRPNSSTVLGYIGGGLGGAISAGTANDLAIRSDAALYFATNGNLPRAVIDSAGNVGIGTSNPTEKLHVSAGSVLINDGGDLKIRPTIPGANGAIKFFDTAGANITNIYFAGTDLFRISDSAGVDRLIINSAGNVGVGSTALNYKLNISGALAIRGDESANNEKIHFQASDNSNRFTIKTDLDANTANDLLVFRGLSSVADNMLVLKGNGNVGIGTTSPTALLTVKGTGTGVAEIGQWVNSSAFSAIYLNGDWSTANNYNIISSPTDKELYINRPSGQSIRFRMNNIEQMTLDTNGHLGIGTGGPGSSRLHVKNSAEVIRIESTATRGTGNNYLAYYDPTGIKGYIGYGGTANDHLNIVNSIGSADITLLTNAGAGSLERMRITSGGNVGIGTTSPLGRLGVASNTGEVGLNIGTSVSPERGNLWYDTDGSGWKFNIGKFQSSTFTSQMTFQDNGNVGIGTTSPGSKLDVNGSINILNNNNLTWGGAYGANIPTIAGTSGASARIGFYPAGSTSGEVAALTSTGLGLGTNSPGSRLHVKSSAEVIRIESTATRGTGQNYIGFYDPTGRKAYFGNGSISNDDLHISNDLNAAIIFSTNGTERLNINASSGNVSINNGNLVIGTSGKGIDFSNTTPDGTGATVSSELLDDYEEGGFTPTLTAEGTAGTPSYNEHYGSYTKIGNRVYFTLYIDLISWAGSPAGTMRIDGLPFNNGTGTDTPVNILASNLSWTAGRQLAPYVRSATSRIYFGQISNGSAVSDAAVDTAFIINIAGTYGV